MGVKTYHYFENNPHFLDEPVFISVFNHKKINSSNLVSTIFLTRVIFI